MTHIGFNYTNWRGEYHYYVIAVEAITFTRSGHPPDSNTEKWMVHGQVITRDGDSREGMGDNRRRSFILSEMESITEVPIERPINLGEARDRMVSAITDIRLAGHKVWVYEDAIYIGEVGEEFTYVDPDDPTKRPPAHIGRRRTP